MIPAELRAAAIRLAAVVVGLIGLVLVVGLTVKSCDRHKSEAAQQKVNQGQQGAAHESAADSINTVTGVGTNAAASEELTRSNEKEIRNAEGANDPVNPAARDAGLRSLCRRPAYRDNPKCRLLEPPAR